MWMIVYVRKSRSDPAVRSPFHSEHLLSSQWMTFWRSPEKCCWTVNGDFLLPYRVKLRVQWGEMTRFWTSSELKMSMLLGKVRCFIECLWGDRDDLRILRNVVIRCHSGVFGGSFSYTKLNQFDCDFLIKLSWSVKIIMIAGFIHL